MRRWPAAARDSHDDDSSGSGRDALVRRGSAGWKRALPSGFRLGFGATWSICSKRDGRRRGDVVRLAQAVRFRRRQTRSVARGRTGATAPVGQAPRNASFGCGAGRVRMSAGSSLRPRGRSGPACRRRGRRGRPRPRQPTAHARSQARRPAGSTSRPTPPSGPLGAEDLDGACEPRWLLHPRHHQQLEQLDRTLLTPADPGPGVWVERGRIEVRFDGAEDALVRLYTSGPGARKRSVGGWSSRRGPTAVGKFVEFFAGRIFGACYPGESPRHDRIILDSARQHMYTSERCL